MSVDDDDIIAFDEDDEQIKSKRSAKSKNSQISPQQSPSSNKMTFTSKVNKLAPPPRADSSQNEGSLKEQEEQPGINFSKLFKKSKDAQPMANSLKVQTQSNPIEKGRSLFLKQEDSMVQSGMIEDEPGIIKLEDAPEEEVPEEEEDVLVIGKDKIEAKKKGDDSKISSKVEMRDKMKGQGDDELQKFESKEGDDYSPKLANQSMNIKGGTTEPFPASDENRQENIDTIFSQSMKIGLQSVDPKTDYYGISILSIKGTLFMTSIKMAFKRSFLNPILPFIVIITILDASLTSISQWQFLSIYCGLLAIIPTISWYYIYRQELTQEFKADKYPVLMFDFSLKKFINRFINKIYPGALILVRKGERIPAPMIILNSDGNEFSQISYGEEVKSFKNLTPKLQDGELSYLDGQVEYNELPLFSNGTKARLRLDLLEPVDIGLSQADLVEEYGIVESTQVMGIVLHSAQKQKYYREALSFNLPLFLNPLKAEIFSIVICLVLALTFSIAGVVWSKENQLRHLYINEQSEYNFLGLLIDRIIIFSVVVPVFIEIIRPFFLINARHRINNDIGLDPQRSGQLSRINSYIAIDNVASTKFVNYGQVLNDKRLKVTRASLIGGPINDEENEDKQYQKDNYEIKMNKELEDQKAPKQQAQQFSMLDIDQDCSCGDIDRRSYIFERSLLSLPFGKLNDVQLAIQKFCQLGECVQFAYSPTTRSILLPGENLKCYTIKLIVQNDLWEAYLYELPRYEEKEGDSDDEDASDLQQLQDRIKKDRELFEKMTTKRYIWVINADIECNLCKEHPQLSNFIAGRAIFEYEFKEDEYKKLFKQLGKQAFAQLYTHLPAYVEEQLLTQIKPMAVFQFEHQIQHNFHLLLDMNLAIIRQWIFTKDIENDATIQCLRQYMECIELTKDDLNNELNNIKGQSVPLLRQSLKNFKVYDNLYKIDDKFIALIVNAEVMDSVLNGDFKQQFFDTLLLASFVIFHDITRQQIEFIVQLQKDQNQTTISIGNNDNDLLLCRTNTIRGCVQSQVKGRPSLFSQMPHIELTCVDALSKLVLTHARQTHIRTSGFVLFQLYKSFLIVMCEFFFSFFNGYSSSQLFTTSFHFMFQTYMTSIYGFLIFYFYSDVSHRVMRIFAGEFIKCQRDYYFNRKKLILIFIDSIYQGFIIFYLPANILQYANNENGIIEGFYYISLVSYFTVIITSSIQPLLYFATLSKEQIVVIMFNFCFCIFVIYTTCSSDAWATSIPQYAYHLVSVLNNVKSVFIIVFLSAICLTPTILIQQFEIVADTQLSKMIHYYEEKDIEEEKPKEEKEGNKERKQKQQQQEEPQQEMIEQEQLEKKEMTPEKFNTINQSQMDAVNMSSDNLIQQ